MPVTRQLPPLPNVSIPVVDPETGRMTPQWAVYFTQLDTVLREMRDLIP